jgi:hypothetical protein
MYGMIKVTVSRFILSVANLNAISQPNTPMVDIVLKTVFLQLNV